MMIRRGFCAVCQANRNTLHRLQGKYFLWTWITVPEKAANQMASPRRRSHHPVSDEKVTFWWEIFCLCTSKHTKHQNEEHIYKAFPHLMFLVDKMLLAFSITGSYGTGSLYCLKKEWGCEMLQNPPLYIVWCRTNLAFLDFFFPSFRLSFLIPPSLFQFPASTLFIAKCNRWALRKGLSDQLLNYWKS